MVPLSFQYILTFFTAQVRAVRGEMMNQLTLPESKSGQTLLLELGFALGQSHTFGLVAGRC